MSRDSKYYITILLLAAIGLIGIVLIQRIGKPTTAKRQDVLMDTVVSLQVTTHRGSKELADEAMALIRHLDGELSLFNGESSIVKINQAAGKSPVAVPNSVFELLSDAKEIAELSDGAFDPTIGPITQLWNIGGSDLERESVPSHENIARALLAVGYDKLQVMEPDRVFLTEEGAVLDLGAIAKGYVAQKTAELLRSKGAISAIIDLGGNIQLIGARPDGKPWRIGLRDPLGKRDESLCVIEALDEVIVTAGVYERFFTVKDRRYPHIFNPSTGRPVRDVILSATVVGTNGTEADALATALVVMWEISQTRSLDLLKVFPGTEALLVSRQNDGTLLATVTPGLKGRIKELAQGVTVEYLE